MVGLGGKNGLMTYGVVCCCGAVGDVEMDGELFVLKFFFNKWTMSKKGSVNKMSEFK